MRIAANNHPPEIYFLEVDEQVEFWRHPPYRVVMAVELHQSLATNHFLGQPVKPVMCQIFKRKKE